MSSEDTNNKKKKKRMPMKLNPTVINLIRECEIMNFGEQQTLDYIENMTTYRISNDKYYYLKKRMALDDSSWLFNFARGGFIHFFRERMFVFQNLLEKLVVQYSMELSSRPHENQDVERLKVLGEQIMKVNTLLAQYGMSSPVIVAMKIAADPQRKFPELDDIMSEKEKEKMLLGFGKQFGQYIGRSSDANPRSTPQAESADDANKNHFINISDVGEKLAEQQGVRYTELYNSNDETNSSSSLPDYTGKSKEDREREYRKQKDDFVF